MHKKENCRPGQTSSNAKFLVDIISQSKKDVMKREAKRRAAKLGSSNSKDSLIVSSNHEKLRSLSQNLQALKDTAELDQMISRQALSPTFSENSKLTNSQSSPSLTPSWSPSLSTCLPASKSPSFSPSLSQNSPSISENFEADFFEAFSQAKVLPASKSPSFSPSLENWSQNSPSISPSFDADVSQAKVQSVQSPGPPLELNETSDIIGSISPMGSTSMQLNSRSKIESPEHATEEHVQQCKSEVEKLKCQLDQRISELARNHQEKEIMELERERQMEELEILVKRRGCDLETSQRVLQLTKSQVDNLLRDLSRCREDLQFSRSQVDDLQQELARSQEELQLSKSQFVRSQEELQLSKSQIHDLQRDQKLEVRELKRELSFFQERTTEESARLQKKSTEEQVSAYESKIEMLESKVEMLEGQLEQRDIALHLAKSQEEDLHLSKSRIEQRDIALHLAKSQEEDLHLSKSRVGNLELNLQQEKATSSQEKASSPPQSLESNKWRELNKMIRTL